VNREDLERRSREIVERMPQRSAGSDLVEYSREVWNWHLNVELEYAEDWRLLGRVGVLMEERSEVAEEEIEDLEKGGFEGQEVLVSLGEIANPAVAAMGEEHMIEREWMRGVTEEGLNCTVRAAMVLWNEGVTGRNAHKLYDEYVRLFRESGRRLMVAWDTGMREWSICAMRLAGEGRIRFGLSDEFVVGAALGFPRAPTIRAGRLRDVVQQHRPLDPPSDRAQGRL
jgi:hypothetical protein